MDGKFPRPSPLFSYKRGDHIMSDPSTRPEFAEVLQTFLDQRMRPNYSRLGIFDPDLLDPPDSYPFVEYSDFDADRRAMLLTCRLTWAVERLPANYLTTSAIAGLTDATKRIAEGEKEDGWEATRLVAKALKRAIAASEEENRLLAKAGPQPARPGHMMAEGQVLARVKGMIRDNAAYHRKAQFDEPVNAFTMLSGDRLAKPGDMLTACTTSDTEEHEIKTFAGAKKTVYTTWVVNI